MNQQTHPARRWRCSRAGRCTRWLRQERRTKAEAASRHRRLRRRKGRSAQDRVRLRRAGRRWRLDVRPRQWSQGGRKRVWRQGRDQLRGKVPESADAERVFRDLAGQGNKLVFGTTFGYMEPMLKVAADNAGIKFEHATGYKTAPNMRTYDSRTYEGAYMGA